MGDSIAVGLTHAMPECEREAHGGLSSAAFAARYVQQIGQDLVIISLGSNDDGTADTAASLRLVRSRIAAARVIWLLPNGRPARTVIERVAAEVGDEVIDTAGRYTTGHRIHPTLTQNRALAREIIGPRPPLLAASAGR